MVCGTSLAGKGLALVPAEEAVNAVMERANAHRREREAVTAACKQQQLRQGQGQGDGGGQAAASAAHPMTARLLSRLIKVGGQIPKLRRGLGGRMLGV